MMRRVVLAGMFAASPLAIADSNHYNNMLIGDRASGMAGAYAAVSDDPSGLYYNPAGIVYAGSRNFSASVNAYHTSSTRYKNVIGGQDWERTSSSLLPNFFGVVQPLGKGLIGFSYAVTDSVIEDQDFSTLVGADRFIMNLNYRDSTNKFGPSYAYPISDSLAVGATLYAHFRNTKLIANQMVQSTTSPTFLLNNVYNEADETGIEPILGIMWSPADRVSIGASVRKTSIINSSWGIQTMAASDTSTPIITFPANSNGYGEDKRNMPTETRIGAAYFPSNRLLLSADMTHHSATEASGPFPAKEATLNIALGVEYYPSSTWAVRTGFYTNNSNNPAPDASKTDQDDHIDLRGVTLSLTHITRTSSLTGGIGYAKGSGEAQPYSQDNQIRDVEASSFTAYLSSSYSY